MKTLADIKKDFMREASEYDTGKSVEDFHTYLRHHNLEHHLSETQIQDRNRESNGLNGGSLVLGLAVPLTLGAIFGFQKLTSNIIGHGAHDQFNYDEARQMMGIRQPRYNARMDESLSGFNTRPMPTADGHISQEVNNFFNNDLMPKFRQQYFEKTGGDAGYGLFPPQEESLL